MTDGKFVGLLLVLFFIGMAVRFVVKRNKEGGSTWNAKGKTRNQKKK